MKLDISSMIKGSMLKGESLFRNNVPIYLSITEEPRRKDSFLHNHDCLEIQYVYSGKGVHIVGDSTYQASKGDLFIINYNTLHVFFQDEEDKDGDFVVYNCAFKPEFLDASLINNTNFKDIAEFLLTNNSFYEEKPVIALRIDSESQSELEAILNKMSIEYTTMVNGYSNILRACLTEFLIKMFRLLESEKCRQNTNVHKLDIMNKAINFLKENHSLNDLNVEEVASKTYLSKSYFSKLFKEITGQSFLEYLQNLRISEACTLLKTTDEKVTKIMSDVGYNDSKHFHQLFKRKMGMTPTEYKKKNV